MEESHIEFLVGTCQVQLKNLCFFGRASIDHAVNQLAEVFRLSCASHSKQNLIPVVLYPDELEKVLEESGLSMQHFVQIQPDLHKLTPSAHLRCVHGRQRYEAALLVGGPDMWWGIRLYCIPRGSDISRLLRKETDQF